MLKVRFPVSPWENNYIELESGLRESVIEPPSTVQTMLAYSCLEKYASRSKGAEWYKDGFSFSITSEKILKRFTDILSKPVYVVLAEAMKRHKLADVKYVDLDRNTSSVTSLRRINAEPGYLVPNEKKFFVIQCKKFSDKNPYSKSDLTLSDLCIIDKNERSPANICLKVINSILSGRVAIDKNVSMRKLEQTVENYFSQTVWPVNFLLMTALLYLYERIITLSLYFRTPCFGEAVCFVTKYTGSNILECEKSIKPDEFLDTVGLRG